MSVSNPATAVRYRWATAGDINAFFGLMLDNIAALVLLVGLLSTQGVPAEFSLRYMIPGTAFGVLFGDLIYTLMAFRLARRTGRPDVTAMPLGLDTPATFGIVLFVLGPAFQSAQQRGLDVAAASHFTWQVGICTLLVSGLFKLACALGAGWVRRLFPRAGLLGSLSAVALVLISFIPLLDILHDPIVGLVALSIILTTLVARVDLPLRIPGALGALIVGSLIYYLMRWMHWPAGVEFATAPLTSVWFPTEWLGALRGEWTSAMSVSLTYLPVAIPFALATVVGGIDCSESAAAVGDDYDTGQVIAVEGLATLVAALCGGVIQTTPYIGHPAYKAMGGRAAYTLATALFVGGAGIVGYFSTIYAVLPLAAVYPILVFIGLEITAQSFAATPERHYPAVALACVPAMAYLIMIYVDQLLGESHTELDSLSARFAQQLTTLRLLGGGFIITSLLWGSTLAALIDRRLNAAAAFLAVAGAASFFGVIHSLHPGTPIDLPWNLPESTLGPSPYVLTIAYAASAGMLMGWSWWRGASGANPKLGTGNAACGELSRAEIGRLTMLKRVLETEVMDSAAEARDYDAMDHAEVNRRFVADLLGAGPIAGELLAGEILDNEILDLGTGTAQIPIELCRQHPAVRVLAIDLARHMLELAEENLRRAGLQARIRTELVDGKRLPYADRSFAAVISNSIVHHIPEPHSALAEAVRVTAVGGRLFVRDLLRPADDQTVRHLVETYAAGANQHQRQMFDDSLRAALDMNEIRSLVTALGFAAESVQQTSDRHWTWSAIRPAST